MINRQLVVRDIIKFSERRCLFLKYFKEKGFKTEKVKVNHGLCVTIKLDDLFKIANIFNQTYKIKERLKVSDKISVIEKAFIDVENYLKGIKNV